MTYRQAARGMGRTAALILCLGTFNAGPAQADSFADVLDHVRPAVVGIGTLQPTRTPARFLGTGFAVGDGLHVLTNAHVVNHTLDPELREHFVVIVGRGAGATMRNAEKVASNPAHDLALLRIDGDPLPVLRIGDSSRVREGERYAFTGFPIGNVLGLYPATHGAMISAITPIAVPLDRAGQLAPHLIERLRVPPFNVFQLDATAYPGNSGSPLYSPEDGTVIAIMNMVMVKDTRESVIERPSGISFAIPIEYALPLLRDAGQDDP